MKVIDKDNHTPVEGVTVKIDTHGTVGVKDDMEYGTPHGVTTDMNGEFKHRFTVTPYPSERPHWFLKVSKKGYEPFVVDIKPNPQPDRNETATPLNVTVELKRVASEPQLLP